MRPFYGVSAEVALLGGFLALAPAVPGGLVFALYVVAAELLATYLLHCPAHYLVGAALGLRFQRMSIGRTTLARVLPGRVASLARLLPVLTLSTDKSSLAVSSRRRVAAMYASGTVASVLSALAIAITAVCLEPSEYSVPALIVALAYLAFDSAFSPRSGDLMRARRALSG